MKRIAWIVFGWIVLQPSVQAAAFNCGKAATQVEKLICSDTELSKLDEDLNQAYLRALQRPDVKQQAIESQRQWLRKTRNVCQSVACIKTAYQNRIGELGFTSSFGIVFMHDTPRQPAAKAAAPQPAVLQAASAPQAAAAQAAAPPAETPAAQAVQTAPANAAQCDASVIPDVAQLPVSDAAARLLATARTTLEQQQYECAVRSLEQANRVIVSMADAGKRAATGFEAKDVAFGMLRQKLPNAALEKRAIAAAVQSLDANGNVSASASEDERFNDAAFFGRVADARCEDKGFLIKSANCEYRDAIIKLYQLDFSLPPARHYVEAWQHNRYLQELNVSEIARLWEKAPAEDRAAIETALGSRFGQPLQSYVLIGTEWMPPEKAKGEAEGFTLLQPAIERLKAKQGDFWIWWVYRYMAEAYWQAGDKEKATQLLASARDSIKAAKAIPGARAGAYKDLAVSLCKLIRNNGIVAQRCPVGIYDAKEMDALLDEADAIAKAASESYSLNVLGVLRKRLHPEAGT